MKPIRTESAVTVIAWMCGSLFALYLAFSAKSTAAIMAAVDSPSWTRFLIGIPWPAVWVALAAPMAVLAWIAASVAKRTPWAAYAYAVIVVVLLGVLYWVAVVVPTGSVLAGGL